MSDSAGRSEESRAAELKQVPELDGVRGLALALVLELHLFASAFGPLRRVAGAGWVGVDMFFVLSGFLITRILRNSRESPAFFRNFYARRALRIWPLYYLIVAFAFFGTRLLPAGLQVGTPLLPYYLTFTQNLVGSIGFGPWAVAVTWSLAIEEQFYLAFPICVRFLDRKRLLGVLLVLLLAMPLGRFVALNRGVSPNTVYMTTWFRLDTLAAGALAALFVESSLRSRVERLCGPASAFALTAGAILCFTVFDGDILILEQSAIAGFRAAAFSITFSLLAIGFAAFVVLAASDRALVLRHILRNRALRALGRISFGVYLIHGIAIVLSQHFVRAWLNSTGMPSKLVTACVAITALGSSLLLAAISWRFLEEPILRLRRFFPAQGTMASRAQNHGASRLSV